MDPIDNTGGVAPAAQTPVIKPEVSAAPAPAVAPAVAPTPSPAAQPTLESVAPAAVVAEPVPSTESKASAEPAPAASPEVAPAKTTILGTEPPKPADAAAAPTPENKDAKPAVAEAPAAEPKKEEGGQSAEPAPLPAYEPFKFPEGLQVDEKKFGEFTKELGEFEVSTKADHGAVQEFAQKLVNRYAAETQETVKRIVDHYTNTWEKTKNEWREAFIADPEMGGNRQQTTATSVQNFVSEFGGDVKQIEELRGFMESGVGNNPNLIRLMNNANNAVKALRMKYESESNTPLPGQKPVSEKKSKTQTLYGKSSASA